MSCHSGRVVSASIVANEPRGGYYSLRLRLDDALIARTVQPGQFVELGLGQSGHSDLILRRPFSVFQGDAQAGELEILYQVIGEGTRRLAEMLTGIELSVMGSLGNRWPVSEDAQRILLLAGGIGAAPLAMLAKELVTAGKSVTMVLAARGQDYLCEVEWYQRLLPHGKVLIATDDGSVGQAGLITEPVRELLADDEPYDVAYICGPEPMMQACATLCGQAGLLAWVSMERLMACGVGACLSCVLPTTKGLQRVCADGPIFAAEEVCWDDARSSRVH